MTRRAFGHNLCCDDQSSSVVLRGEIVDTCFHCTSSNHWVWTQTFFFPFRWFSHYWRSTTTPWRRNIIQPNIYYFHFINTRPWDLSFYILGMKRVDSGDEASAGRLTAGEVSLVVLTLTLFSLKLRFDWNWTELNWFCFPGDLRHLCAIDKFCFLSLTSHSWNWSGWSSSVLKQILRWTRTWSTTLFPEVSQVTPPVCHHLVVKPLQAKNNNFRIFLAEIPWLQGSLSGFFNFPSFCSSFEPRSRSRSSASDWLPRPTASQFPAPHCPSELLRDVYLAVISLGVQPLVIFLPDCGTW